LQRIPLHAATEPERPPASQELIHLLGHSEKPPILGIDGQKWNQPQIFAVDR
jgi:hypothetical protein